MASQTRWTWVWVNSGSWWWAGRPGVLGFMGSQRVGHDWATELNCTDTVHGVTNSQTWLSERLSLQLQVLSFMLFLHQFQLTGLFLIVVLFSCFFFIPDNIFQDVTHGKCFLLGTRSFCIPTNNLEFHSSTQINCWEAFDPSKALILAFNLCQVRPR